MVNKNDNLKALDKAGWDLFYAGGMRDIRLYSATVGAVRELQNEKKKEEEQIQPGM